MRAIQIVTLDGPQAVQLNEVPEPEATGMDGAELVVVDIHAAGVSYPELLQTRGLYQIKPPTPFIPGIEVAGVVRSAPADSEWKPGDRVAALAAGYCEVAACDRQMVFPLPENLSFAQGAALPMNALTMHFALTVRGDLQAGETVLVHGAAGGIGTATIKHAKALGATVIAVASTEDKRAFALQAGADHAIAPEGFKDAAKELTDGRGVDMVVDPVGGDRFTDSLRSLAKLGRLLVIGFTGGEIPTVKVNRLLLNNISVVGVGWGDYWMARGVDFLRTQWDELYPLLEAGRLDPAISHVMPLAEAGAALEMMDQRKLLGKIVLDTTA